VSSENREIEMEKVTKDYGPSLLQKNPSREVLLGKMRDKLARNHPIAHVQEVQMREVRKRQRVSWAVRILLFAIIVGVNFILIGQKDTLMSHLGYQAVPSLPKPRASLSPDEQALYWTYALYDIQKFRTRFNVLGYFAIDQKSAKKSLEALLPEISNATLGEISSYAPVAFRSVGSGEPSR